MTVDDQVASAELQNPADALEFLAHVAERDSGVNHLPPMHSSVYSRSPHPMHNINNNMPREGSRAPYPARDITVIDFPPLTKGHLNVEMLHMLLMR